MRSRISALDNARGIGMILVVAGHALASGLAYDAIYAFHMPLFFVLSGMLMPGGEQTPLGRYALRLAYSLLIPFAFFGVVTLIYYIAMQRVMTGQFLALPDILQAAAAIAYGVAEHTPANWTLWFFPCLVLTATGSFALIQAVGRAMGFGITLLLALLLLVAGPLPFRLPWSADAAVVAALFLQIGLWLGSLDLLVGSAPILRHRGWTAVLGVLALAATVVIARVNGRVDLANLVFGHPALYALGALLGTAGALLISMALPGSKLLRRFSDDGRVIFPLHTLVFGFLTGVLTVLLHVDRGLLKESNLAVALYVVAGFALTLPAAWVLRRIAPWLIGERRPGTPASLPPS